MESGELANIYVRLLITASRSYLIIFVKVYSFIEITSDIPHMFTNKVQVIRNTAHRPSKQASYTTGTTMQENQQTAQIAAKHNIIPQNAPYMSWIFLVLVGIDPGVSHLGGEIVSHNTTDAVAACLHSFSLCFTQVRSWSRFQLRLLDSLFRASYGASKTILCVAEVITPWKSIVGFFCSTYTNFDDSVRHSK